MSGEEFLAKLKPILTGAPPKRERKCFVKRRTWTTMRQDYLGQKFAQGDASPELDGGIAKFLVKVMDAEMSAGIGC